MDRPLRKSVSQGVTVDPDHLYPNTAIDTAPPDGSIVEFTERAAARVAADPEIAVGIPAYNEAESIASLVSRVSRDADLVIVVDDGSTDGTAERARDAGAVVIDHGYNRGYGAALKTVLREAASRNARHLVTIDGDGQHAPVDVLALVAAQRETGAAIVIGSRFVDGASENMSRSRRFGVATVNALTNLSLGAFGSSRRISDTQSGLRAYDRRAIRSLADDERVGDGMTANTDILYHARRRKYEITEIGATVRYDVENANTENAVSHGYSLVGNIASTVQGAHPLCSLGLFGAASLLGAVGAGYWLATTYLATGTLSFVLAAVAALFGFAGFFACLGALILHVLTIYSHHVG